MYRLAMERDTVERDSRDKETRILSLTRELTEIRERLEDMERLKSVQARELEDLMSSKDDVGKNVSDTQISTTLTDVLTTYTINTKFASFQILDTMNKKGIHTLP